MIALGKKYGEASRLRVLKSGAAYDHLFEKAPGKVFTIKKDSGLQDTVEFIPKVVQQTLYQTKGIAKELKRGSVYENCKSIWHFVYDHIQYRKDEHGYEQIRSPRRTWHDREQGVDCDCYSVFISSILSNLGIPHQLRITKYNEDHFQHIYPVVPYNGRYITIDCVTDQFDYEVPYSAKRDYTMDLQFLDGIPDYEGDLGKLFKKKKSGSTSSQSAGPSAAPAKKKKGLFSKLKPNAKAAGSSGSAPKKKKGIFKKIGSAVKKTVKKIDVRKVVNKINKLNPAAVALRNGLLLALKQNLKNISARIYPAYVSPEEAFSQYKINPDQHAKLNHVRQKLEKIFETAGGKKSNMEKAIRKGREHSVKAKAKRLNRKAKRGVDGLAQLPEYGAGSLVGVPLKQALGHDLYYSENVEGLNGLDAIGNLGELGEPVTVIIAAAGAALETISKLIGQIFKGNPPNEDYTEEANSAADNEAGIPSTGNPPSTATAPILPNASGGSDSEQASTDDSNNESGEGTSSADETEETEDIDTISDAGNNSITKSATGVTNTNNNTPDKESFWQKKWVKPTAVIGGSLLLVLIAAKALGGSSQKNKSSPRNNSLNGFPRKRKKHKRKKKHKKLSAVALR